MKPLVILTGPTAVGKTAMSVELAKRINGEIISADSIQVYKYLDIGSAKVTQEEMDGVKHYLIDELEPDENFDITVFKDKAVKYIEEIYSKGKVPIIAGGTGFYIQSVLFDIQFEDADADAEYRKELEETVKTKGPEYIHNILRNIDPKSAEIIHYNNVKRVIRALEYYKKTGKPISEHNEVQRQNESPYNFVYFVLNDDRELLYERINKRVDIMVEDGLFEEVEGLIKKGYSRELNSMQGIGYREVFDFFDGNLTKEETIEKIKLNTRHFAKRQLTWFKREKSVTMVDLNDFDHDKEKVLSYMTDLLKNKNII
ncbi:MAG: tRNA (adenosine(37)-N6)-dimethylallyltransferase MiaA [Lachnospiraceae bacterium]|nr:tRNA (adenosine(37)-N6)-dimethylallyltransferase MiaA [Lachnospiraceae bacterium]